MTKPLSITQGIKEYAREIGFDAIGICKAEPVNETAKQHLSAWLAAAYGAEMEYLSRNVDKRENPALLVEGAKSVICVALNYYPHRKLPDLSPQIAYYAYGKDYHDVLKDKLRKLFAFIKTLLPEVSGREFVDTAPLLERYWAARAGIGFIGKNTMLIIPRKGSYFFLGEIVIDTELEYDSPINISCGSCTRCREACPTRAFEKPYCLNSRKCISYQTIENRGEIDKEIIPHMTNNLYGCDICQKVCPFNSFAKPHSTDEFLPTDEFLSLDCRLWQNMSEDDYRRIFKGSAVKRAKYSGLMRNFDALKSNAIE